MNDYSVSLNYSKSTRVTAEKLTRAEAVKLIIKAETKGATCFLFRGLRALEYQSPWGK